MHYLRHLQIRSTNKKSCGLFRVLVNINIVTHIIRNDCMDLVLGYNMVKWQAITILIGGGGHILVWHALLDALTVKTEGKIGKIWRTRGYHTPK
jgi:hypothetical protein